METGTNGLLAGNGGVIARAVEFAAIKHNGKKRKNPERDIPYIAHPVKVGMMLREADFDEEVVAAGILHDTIEDSDATEPELKVEFGDRVARLVISVTEPDKSHSWTERQQAYLERIGSANKETLAISACDKIDNMRSMLQSLRAGFNVYERMNAPPDQQIAKFEKLHQVYAGRVPDTIRELFADTLREVITETRSLQPGWSE